MSSWGREIGGYLFKGWGKKIKKKRKWGERDGIREKEWRGKKEKKRGFLISLLCLQDIRRILEWKVSKLSILCLFLFFNRLIIILFYSFVNSDRLILISNIHYPLWTMPFHFSYLSKYHAGYQYKGSHLWRQNCLLWWLGFSFDLHPAQYSRINLIPLWYPVMVNDGIKHIDF